MSYIFTMSECLKHPEFDPEFDTDSESAPQFCIPSVIPEEVARMAVHLTEYYQSQRLVYSAVS